LRLAHLACNAAGGGKVGSLNIQAVIAYNTKNNYAHLRGREVTQKLREAAAENGRKNGPQNAAIMNAKKTPEQRVAHAKAGAAALTFEQRSAAGKRGAAVTNRKRWES
jgi:hypothetical protein